MNASTTLYFFAIVLPGDIAAKVRKIQLDFQSRFHCEKSLHSPPHITLFPPFTFKVNNETKLAFGLDSFAKRNESFKIELSGFGCFDKRKNKVIFIHPTENEKLKQAQVRLSRFVTAEFGIENQNAKFPFHAHCTVAFRDLSNEMFHAAWSEYKTQVFEEQFTAGSIGLLKHFGNEWKVLHQSPLAISED